MRIRKLHLNIFFILSLFVFSTGFFHVEAHEKDQLTYEMMRKVDSYDEAVAYEDMYDIDLLSYSLYGYATYQVTNEKQEELLSHEFVMSSYARQTAIDDTYVAIDPYANQQYAIDLMDVDQAWSITTGSTNVVIAIIDSGIDTDHEEFEGKISSLSYNSRTKQVGLAYIEDDTGHGTMVAGVIGAKHDNAKGIKGIMEFSTLLIIKANNQDNPNTPDEDESELYSDSNIIEAIYYAVDHGADVINLSLGGTYANPLTREAVEYAHEEGVIVVAASGNDGNDDLLYPASFSEVISVGSVGETRIVSDFSNYNSMVDISAPGEDIVTTYLNNEYRSASGTSFAAPQVSGVIGLLLAHNPNQTPLEIFERVTSTAIDRGTIGKDNYYGYGIINAYQSLLFSYYVVSFETFGGTLMDSIVVESNEAFQVANPEKIGHVFQGWYLDSEFTLVFNMGSQFVTADTILYAKFVPQVYTITLIGRLSDQDTVQKSYGSIMEDDIFSYEGYSFSGWFYDQAFTQPYGSDLITGETTLYGKFDVIKYTVFYSVESTIVYSEQFDYGTTPILYEPNPNQMTIEGWYKDQIFLSIYEPEPLYEDMILYGKVDYTELHVTYYDDDLETILLYEIVSYGESVTSPTPPIKENSPSLSFEFQGWSDSSSFVTKNLNIYPIYEVTYHNETVYLIPQVDTIYQGTDYIDQGIHLIDENLEYIVSGEVDASTQGKYAIIYQVFYGEEQLDLLVRVVHVIEQKTEVEITIHPTITTIYEGESYVEEGATSNVGDVLIIGEVNESIPGVYQITYQVTYDNTIIERILYVHVLAKTGITFDEAYLPKEEEVELL
jgi:uncharacterized repeat protein (TIGR02543 family)